MEKIDELKKELKELKEDFENLKVGYENLVEYQEFLAANINLYVSLDQGDRPMILDIIDKNPQLLKDIIDKFRTNRITELRKMKINKIQNGITA